MSPYHQGWLVGFLAGVSTFWWVAYLWRILREPKKPAPRGEGHGGM